MKIRLRPNLVTEPSSIDIEFLENDWAGAYPRCVVTALAQADLPADLNLLRATARYNNVIVGIRTSVLQGGTVSGNAPIWLEKTT